MYKRCLQFLILLVVLLATACGGGVGAEPENESADPVMGEIVYEEIDLQSAEFEQLYQGDFRDWYDSSCRDRGVYFFNQDSSTYLLVCAGEKPTSGYELKNLILIGEEDVIQVSADLKVPGVNEVVSEVLTYPHILVRIPGDDREIALKEIRENSPELGTEVKTDSGAYVGQIDPHSIEIKISGVPEEKAAKAFELGEELRENWGSYDLNEGDAVRFTYIPREGMQPVILTIEKI